MALIVPNKALEAATGLRQWMQAIRKREEVPAGLQLVAQHPGDGAHPVELPIEARHPAGVDVPPVTRDSRGRPYFLGGPTRLAERARARQGAFPRPIR